jgi:hypothetical protein
VRPRPSPWRNSFSNISNAASASMPRSFVQRWKQPLAHPTPAAPGTPERRAPFEATRLTIKVDCLERVIAVLADAGSEQLEPIQKTPVGRKTRFRHPDGTVVEYVDHDTASSG